MALFGQAARELVEAVQAFLDVGHAGGVAQADVLIRAKGNAPHGRHLLLFQ